MKKLLLLSFTAGFLLIAKTDALAQNYQNALGVRLGPYNGLNYKTFLNSNKALDFNLSFRNNDDNDRFFFTGLYEIHNSINDAPGLNWYYGSGASIGSFKRRNFEGEAFLSVDGVIGLDYKFEGAPINLALDWRPRLEITPNSGISSNDLGLAIRFTF